VRHTKQLNLDTIRYRRAGRAGGVAALPRRRRKAGPVTPPGRGAGPATARRSAMNPAPRGRRWRRASRRGGTYRLCRGNLARPGRGQP